MLSSMGVCELFTTERRSTHMFGLFKKDPVATLQKEHQALLKEAHRLSTVDRARSDKVMAQAAEVEDRLLAALAKAKEK
jgi:hypothetical protein